MTPARPPPAGTDAEDGLIPLSALQHYAFCPRQSALIHVEQLWTEDGATAEGRLLHEKVDVGGSDTRAGVRVARGLSIRSMALGVAGKADVVEFAGRPPKPYPVEYKLGKPKSHRADAIQLCAQAICLEEAFGVSVPEGAIYYGATRRRLAVTFDDALRDLTLRTAQAARGDILAGRTPPPVATPACRKCSLVDSCRPERLQRAPPVDRWLARQLAD